MKNVNKILKGNFENINSHLVVSTLNVVPVKYVATRTAITIMFTVLLIEILSHTPSIPD